MRMNREKNLLKKKAPHFEIEVTVAAAQAQARESTSEITDFPFTTWLINTNSESTKFLIDTLFQPKFLQKTKQLEEKFLKAFLFKSDVNGMILRTTRT